MLSDRQFRRWIDFLQEQVLVLEALRLGHTEGPHGSPEVVAFLKMNDGLVSERVGQAVSEFAELGAWPNWLNADQIVNLTHRATLAHGLLIMMQNGQLMHARALPMPKSKDRAKFLHWLFVELWQYGGADYLEGLTNSYFADAPSENEASR